MEAPLNAVWLSTTRQVTHSYPQPALLAFDLSEAAGGPQSRRSLSSSLWITWQW